MLDAPGLTNQRGDTIEYVIDKLFGVNVANRFPQSTIPAGARWIITSGMFVVIGDTIDGGNASAQTESTIMGQR